MPSLLDNIDRFTYTAQQIQSTSKTIRSNTNSGRFSRAVLQLPLGDRARDIDASELGLFTLVSHPAATAQTRTGDEEDVHPPALGEIARAEVPAATPLRKPMGGGRTHLGLKGKVKDKEPEVYAEAALKYLDRYDSIRPIPRARQEVSAIIDRLNKLRSEMESMTAVAEQNAPGGSSQGSTVKEEEKRIQQLQTRIKQLKARKEVLAQKKRSTLIQSPPTLPDAHEEAFWGASSSKPRHSLVIHDNEDSLLMDGDIDMGDISVDTFSEMPTPVPTQPKRMNLPLSKLAPPSEEPTKPPMLTSRLLTRPSEARATQPSPLSIPAFDLPPGADISYISESNDSILDDSETTFDEDAENTVVLSRAPILPDSPPREVSVPRAKTPPPVGPTMPIVTPADVRPTTPTQTPGRIEAATPATGRKSKYRITSDTERIVAKIWSTVGDLIMPGHPFKTAAAATTNKPPRAKETIALLENIASKSPPQSSPSTHSLSSFSFNPSDPPSASQPNTQQILTAHLLHTLLISTPTYSMPLNKAKEALSAKGLGAPPPAPGTSLVVLGIVGGQAVETRALYGCVAKRLLKIDRSGREQVLRFDV